MHLSAREADRARPLRETRTHLQHSAPCSCMDLKSHHSAGRFICHHVSNRFCTERQDSDRSPGARTRGVMPQDGLSALYWFDVLLLAQCLRRGQRPQGMSCWKNSVPILNSLRRLGPMPTFPSFGTGCRKLQCEILPKTVVDPLPLTLPP